MDRAAHRLILALLLAAACLVAGSAFLGCHLVPRGQRTVMVPMRDGVRLATDLYFPTGSGEPGQGGAGTAEPRPAASGWPAILIRTPYLKERYAEYTNMFTTHGYVVAVQDVRGRFASEGDWVPFVREGPDGYDTIEWLAAQDWSSGRIGMLGSSYDGYVQYAAAVERPPHLVTIVPNVTVADLFINFPYENGVFTNYAIIWADIVESEATTDMSGEALQRIREKDWANLLDHLPVIELDEKIFGREIPYYREWIEHFTYDSYWKQGTSLEKLRDLDIPVFLQSGWFDENTIGTMTAYPALAESHNEHIKLVIGPWGHTPFAESHFRGEFLGEAAMIDLVALRVRWFDHWLKGIDTGILEEPLVQLYAIGPNRWLYGDTYPLPETELLPFYLSSEGGALPRDGGGSLQAEQPSPAARFDSYTHDPGDPTPDPFGYLERYDLRGYDEAIAAREDLLVYETAPLQESLHLLGPISATLYASSSAVDTDWFVTLYQVDEDGELARFLSRGMVRARFRDSIEQPSLLEADKVYRYDLNLVHTGRTLEVGSRLRLVVSSALFPLYARNLNTGGHNELESEWVIARQRVYHGVEYPSHILLPVVDIQQ